MDGYKSGFLAVAGKVNDFDFQAFGSLVGVFGLVSLVLCILIRYSD